MTNIILPLDFSDATDALLNGAIDFAKTTRGKIFLIHVAPADLGFAIGDMGFQYFPEVEQSEIRSELTHLHQYEERIKSHGLECEHRLLQGPAGDTILQFAVQNNANYLVIGSHGRSNMYDVFIGSLTKELTRRSRIPVVVIPIH